MAGYNPRALALQGEKVFSSRLAVSGDGLQGSAVMSRDHCGDTASVRAVGASSQWDVRLDGLIPGAAALFEAEVNLTYTQGWWLC